MNLLLDLGNTCLKWAVNETCHEVGVGHELPWSGTVADDLATQWAGLERPTAIVAASVTTPERASAVAGVALACFGLPIDWVATPRSAAGVTPAYADVASMGVDRFLGMVAARQDGLAPCVLVSCGTTLVLDALAADGRHLGGLIAPGPRLMQDAVLTGTAQVQPEVAGDVVDTATKTADAVTSGGWHACAALVERFCARTRGRLGGQPAVLLSGGDAHQLQPMLEPAVTLYPNAVLRGLAHWAGLPA